MSTSRRVARLGAGLSTRFRLVGETFLAGPDWFYVATLLVPTAMFDLSLGWLRVTSQYAAPTGLGVLAQLRSDLLAHAGLALLWLVGFAVLRTGWRRVLLLVVLHGSVAAYLLFAVVAHRYYRKSGSVLDAGGLRMTLESPTLTRDLAASETSSAQLWLMAAVVAYGLLGPALLYRLRYRGRSLAGGVLPGVGGTAPRSRRRAAAGARRRLAVVSGAVGIVLVVGSAVPTFTGAGAFSRNRALDVALELGAGALESEQAAAERPALPPAQMTRLPASVSGADRPRNVVLIMMESIRLEATDLGDPGRGTTPFLAELAERSTVAENAYTVVPHTSKAVTATSCGYAPPLDTKLTESDPAGLPAACLPQLLGDQGYRTGYFQSAVGDFERRPDLVKNLGYDSFFPVEAFPTAGFGRANYFGWEDDIMLEPSRDWLQARGASPFLLTYLTVTGHHDYKMPATFGLEQLAEEEDVNNYLNGARYSDRFVSKVFDLLDDEGLAEDTMVVVVADHGEGFGEHGLRQHDNVIYNEGIKVPYLVYDPTDPRRRTVARPVTTMSVTETIAETLGYRMSGGLSREPALKPALGVDVAPQPVRASCQSDNRCLALVDGTTKYVHHFGNRPDEVFDLAADPGERQNLIADVDPARLREWRSDLLRWRSEVRAEYAAPRRR